MSGRRRIEIMLVKNIKAAIHQSKLALTLIVLMGGSLCFAVESGDSAPDFTLKSKSHGNYKLSEQVGNVLLVNFWASWCGPCREEMPLLQDLQDKYEDVGFSIVAINVDENSELANNFLAKVDVDYPILYDNTAQVSQLYQVEAMPTTVIVDRNGKMRFFHKGFKPGYEKKYEKEIKKLLRE